MTSEYRITCPNGHEIIGTRETLIGVAELDPHSIGPHPGLPGQFDYEHAGYTDIDWDSSETVNADPRHNGGYDMFVCDEHDEHPRKDLSLERWNQDTGSYEPV